jgi:hypothetical protein
MNKEPQVWWRALLILGVVYGVGYLLLLQRGVSWPY